jgi:phage shock protein C
MAKLLYRSARNRLLAGVCGGLGEYFGTDPLLFRISFIFLALAGGLGLVLYLVCWLIIPLARTSEGDDCGPEASGGRTGGDPSGLALGVALALLGVWLLLHNLGLINFKWSLAWPLILIALGLRLIIGNRR